MDEQKELDYQKAVGLFGQGKYSEAYNIFSTIMAYKDSKNFFLKCQNEILNSDNNASETKSNDTSVEKVSSPVQNSLKPDDGECMTIYIRYRAKMEVMLANKIDKNVFDECIGQLYLIAGYRDTSDLIAKYVKKYYETEKNEVNAKIDNIQKEIQTMK